MKICIVYPTVEPALQEWLGDRSLALQDLAGSNQLDHVLNQLRDVPAQHLILALERDQVAVTRWIADRLPDFTVDIVSLALGLRATQALRACRTHFDQGPLLVALGSAIVEAEYKDLDRRTADVTLFTPSAMEEGGRELVDPGWAGVCFFHRGTDLRDALDQHEQADFISLIRSLRERGLAVGYQQATMSLDAGTIEGLLFANARLLGLGYGSEDAIERSYMEDFTVIPPVYLHESAVVENAVVGPFTNVEAGAEINGSIVRNSLVGKEARVENAILDGSLLGDNTRVQAAGNALILQKDGEILLD